MAKAAKKIQVVDLGSHFLKVVVAEVTPEGLKIQKAISAPLSGQSTDPDPYFNEVGGVFAGLADQLDRKTPVHFVAPDNLMRTNVGYLNNVDPARTTQDIDAERAKFIQTYGGSAYEQKIDRSFTLRERSQGGKQQLIVAHAYVKMIHLDAIQALCAGKKLQIGGVYPRLFALERLFMLASAADPTMQNAVAVIVDVGWSSTSIAAFKDRSVVFYKVMHIGASDVLRAVTDAARGTSFRPDAASLTTILSSAGVAPSPDAINGLGLGADGAKVASAIVAEVDEIIQKVQLSVDYFSTVAATDFNTSANTVMAVRKGPEVFVFTGGLACSPGFTDLAGQAFQKATVVADPGAFTAPGAASDIPLTLFGPAIAAASVIGEEARPELNLADMYKARSESSVAKMMTPGSEPTVPGWALAIAVLLVGAVMGYAFGILGPEVKKLQAQEIDGRNALSDSFAVITKYKDVRLKEASALVELDYLRELVKNRFDYPTFLNDVVSRMPDGTHLTRIQVQTQLPRMNDSGSDAGKTQPKVVTLKICGEAQEDRLVSDFVEALTKTNHFEVPTSPEVQAAGAGSSGSVACTPSENLKLAKHFAFSIVANVKY